MREENSSSQNVNPYITAISERGSAGAGCEVRLSEGSSFFVSKDFLTSRQLDVGLRVSEDLIEKMGEETVSINAVIKAGELVARAEQSSGGLYRKLKQRGFPDFACRRAVDKCLTLSLVDDTRFAEMWLRSRLRSHPEGKSRLYSGLLERGVSSDAAKSVLEMAVSEEDMLEAVQKAGEKLARKYRGAGDKVKASLYRRGFSNREISYYLENTDI